MTKEEFMALSPQPNRRCIWGGKEYRIKRVSIPSRTVFLADHSHKFRSPYAVGYEKVTLL